MKMLEQRPKTSAVEPLFPATCSDTILRVKHHKGLFPPEESGLNFEIPSCLYDSNNQHSAAWVRAKCREGLGESMGPICQSSVLVYMLERVGQSSVTPRHITTSLSFTSPFIVLSKLLRTSSCTLTQSERRCSSEQNQKLCLKSKTHIQVDETHVYQWFNWS